MSKIVKLFFVSLLVLSFSAIAFAQSTTTGSIGGVVTAGGVINAVTKSGTNEFHGSAPRSVNLKPC